MHVFLEDCLERIPELYIRRMFGGAGIYSGDRMFGIVAARRVYLKTDVTSRVAFTDRGMLPFRTSKDLVLKSYYEVPADVLDDDVELLRWARRALDVARVAPAKPEKTPRSRPKLKHEVSPETILDGYPPAIRDLAERACKLVQGEAPGATKAGYAGWKLIGYRAPHYFCFVAPQRDHVRLGFEHGHRLPDPDGVLEAMGKQVRFVRLTPGKKPPTKAMRQLIREALRPPNQKLPLSK